MTIREFRKVYLPGITCFIELREITFLKIEMTVRVWENLRVSSEFSFFSP